MISEEQKTNLAGTVKTNINILLNILKVYYVNTHQDKPKLTDTEGKGRLQLSVDTRKTLGKRPPHHQNVPEPHTCSPPPQKRHNHTPP
jgi:hypothetical protein